MRMPLWRLSAPDLRPRTAIRFWDPPERRHEARIDTVKYLSFSPRYAALFHTGTSSKSGEYLGSDNA